MAKRVTGGQLNQAGLMKLKAGAHHDGSGLYFIVGDKNAKGGRPRSWVLRFTVRGGKRNRMGLGPYPVVTLADARDMALDNLRLAEKGFNPVKVRNDTQKITPTFKDAAEAMHGERVENFRNAKHVAQRIGTLREFVFPEIGNLPVDAIDSSDIKRTMMRDVPPYITMKSGSKRKRKARGPLWTALPETASRVLDRLGEVLIWARGTYNHKGAPMEEMAAARKALGDQPAKSVKHMAALPYTEVAEFVADLNKSTASAAVMLALEFLILTAARSGEVRGAMWGEIDAEGATWTRPAERMKAQREHRVPLSARCLEILQAARALSDGTGLIFPSPMKRKGRAVPLSDMALTAFLRRKKLEATAHGFRSSFRDWAAELTNYPRDVCEMALAHSLQDKTEAAYKRTDLFDKRRALMDDWARYCATKKGADVLPFPASKRA